MKRVGSSKLYAYNIIGIFLSLTLSHCGKWNANNPMVPVGPTLTVGTVFTLPGHVEAMAARDNRLYVCLRPFSPDSTAKLLYVVDASDLMSPQVVGSALDHGQYGWVYGLALYGSYAYVNTYSKGLTVLDISNPTAPGVLASYDTLSAIPAGIAGNHLYAIGYGLDYLSLSDPIHPRREGRSNVYNNPRLVAPWDETRCAVYYWNRDRVYMIDFTSPAAPKIIAYSSDTYYPKGLSFCAGSLFGVRNNREPAILRFTWDGGDSIYQAGKADLPGAGEYLASLGNRIVVGVSLSYSNSNLFLLSTTGPQSPYVVGECEIPLYPIRLAGDGNRIYADFGNGNLVAVEVAEH
jgi:hypothetical protein